MKNDKQIWCSTHATSPRKHAHPQPSTDPKISVTLGRGEGIEDRQVNAAWSSEGIYAEVCVSVAMLREMLSAAEKYKNENKNAQPALTLPERALDTLEAIRNDCIRCIDDPDNDTDPMTYMHGFLEATRQIIGEGPTLDELREYDEKAQEN